MKKFTIVSGLFIALSFFAIHPANGQDTAKFKPHGAFTSQVFIDYFYKIGGDTGISSSKGQYAIAPKDYQAFDFRRIYIGYMYWFNPIISAEFNLAHEPSQVAPGNSEKGSAFNYPDFTRGFYVKAANIKFNKVVPMATIVVGQQSTPGFTTFSEPAWQYRSVEKTIADMRGAIGSNDLGIGLYGSFDLADNYGYGLLISNGTGAQDENNRFKKYQAEVHGKFMDKKIWVDVYGDYEPGATFADTSRKTTLKAFLGYVTDPIGVGLEYLTQTVGNNSPKGAPDVKPNGLSIWARAYFTDDKMIGAFARYDLWNPDGENTTTGNKENFLTLGLDYQPYTNVHIEPNLWMDMYSNKSGAANRLSDVVGRLTFFYKY